MTDKELKRLSRQELLEMLLEQTKKVEQLQEKLARAEAELEDRRIRLNNAGNLAQAVLEINGVMEAAQAAADQYLENMAAMEAETKARCQRMLQEAARQSQ